MISNIGYNYVLLGGIVLSLILWAVRPKVLEKLFLSFLAVVFCLSLTFKPPAMIMENSTEIYYVPDVSPAGMGFAFGGVALALFILSVFFVVLNRGKKSLGGGNPNSNSVETL